MLIALAVRIFLWAVDNDQFDDMEGPAHSILFDDDQPKASRPPEKKTDIKQP
ncbi:MAG: cbb3-type cytochrome oxidase assembly protein CcoS [Endozoicomonas sp.]|uniref:cbb3-type cytochrome oxidase assembly protein CcoS n=1 Tax=Endozoicomonas sp. TaxID=1892382 RepID=UPI003D9B8570